MDNITPLSRKEASKFGYQLWVITGTSSKGRHMRIGVAAKEIESAIDAAKKRDPGCKIVSCQHQGPIEIVVEDDL